jgi:hypothetical protein
LKFTVGVGFLKPTVAALVRWGQGRSYAHFRHALLEAKGDLVSLTYTTPLGTAHLTCDAEVEADGSAGVDLEVFGKFLAPYKGKGWELRLSFEPDPKTEDRHVFAGQFFEEGCKRNRVEWPYTDNGNGMFCSPDWVPPPVLQSGVIQEFQAPRPRLLSLLGNGIAAHSAVEKGVAALHSAGLTVAADMASVFTANAVWGIRSELWADGELGFDTGWAGEPSTVSVEAESLSRARLLVDSFGGVEPWVVQVPEAGPIRLCPEVDREAAWVTVKEASDPIALPQMLDELRGAKPGAGTTKVTGSVALNQRAFGGLRSVLMDLAILEAYGREDEAAQNWTVLFQESGLVIEAPSPFHIGAGVVVPWAKAPQTELVRIVNGPKLVALLKALTVATEPDGEIEVSFWSDGELERLYFRTSSPKGEAADAVLMPMSGEPRRVAGMAAREVEDKKPVGASK